ncbi:hypothetical protein IJ732_00355 [bacterium]|nr:hypothetical protein [bacterium]
MFLLYVEKEDAFSEDLVGEYTKLEDARAKLEKIKAKNDNISYRIEEAAGGFNSYGERLTSIVEEG